MILTEFLQGKPLAVITVVGLLDVLMVSNSAELCSFSLTTSILAPSTTNFLSSGSPAEALGRTHFGKRDECSLVVRFEFVYIFGKIPSLALGTSLLSCRLCMGPVLKFHSVGTSLMRNFDLYFSERWSFVFPDTCVNRILRIGPKTFCIGFP